MRPEYVTTSKGLYEVDLISIFSRGFFAFPTDSSCPSSIESFSHEVVTCNFITDARTGYSGGKYSTDTQLIARVFLCVSVIVWCQLRAFTFRVIVRLIGTSSVQSFGLLVSKFSTVLSNVLTLVVSSSNERSHECLYHYGLCSTIARVFLLTKEGDSASVQRRGAMHARGLTRLLFIRVR